MLKMMLIMFFYMRPRTTQVPSFIRAEKSDVALEAAPAPTGGLVPPRPVFPLPGAPSRASGFPGAPGAPGPMGADADDDMYEGGDADGTLTEDLDDDLPRHGDNH